MPPVDPARTALGLAAVGRPAYITAGRARDLGEDRSVAALEARTHGLLDRAWELGVRTVDAARSYGYAERFLGSWLARHPDRRAALLVSSKWGYEYVGGWRTDADLHERKEHSSSMLERQWPESLAALGTTPDVYLVHSVTPDSPLFDDTALLDRLRGIAAEGVRVGISTSGPAQGQVVERALGSADTPFTAVQSTWNLLEQSAGPALARAHAAGWFVVVKEAMANGLLAGPGVSSAVDELARSVGLAPADLAMGVARAMPWADRVLSGAATPAQLVANVSAAPVTVPDEALAGPAESPHAYWERRSGLPWA